MPAATMLPTTAGLTISSICLVDALPAEQGCAAPSTAIGSSTEGARIARSSTALLLCFTVIAQHFLEWKARQNKAGNYGGEPNDERGNDPGGDTSDTQSSRYKRGHQQTNERRYKGNAAQRVRRILPGNFGNQRLQNHGRRSKNTNRNYKRHAFDRKSG